MSKTMTGYKATDKDGKCRGFQFSLPTENEDGSWTPGDWHTHEGELVMCESGFHFCPIMPGVWNYYSEEGTRVFKIEAKEILESEDETGTANKKVCRSIRLMKELEISGEGNSGDGNSGHRNSGHWNSGDKNSGDRNSGHRNSGHWNSGHRNSGHRNSGQWNSGDRNSGDRNSGHRNSGHWNSGDGNSGDGNSGDGNSGDGNATNYSNGMFCIEEPTVMCFDVDTGQTRNQFNSAYGALVSNLSYRLLESKEIPFEPFASLPGITPEKLKALHEKHLSIRNKEKE